MAFANLNMEGRLVNDPEYKVGKENREFCTFRIAVNQQFGAQENTSFFNCTGSEGIANRMRKAQVTKGRMIHINGNLTLREYKNRDGVTCMSADVGILDWHYVGGKPKDADNSAPVAGAYPGTAQGTIRQEQYIGADDDELPL